MSDFFSFDRMITPTIIKIVFWIGLVVTVLGGLIFLLAGNGGVRFLGLLYLVLGPLGVRVYCELLIVIFKMNETLSSIERNTAGSSAGVASSVSP